jgi:hypothetical protein
MQNWIQSSCLFGSRFAGAQAAIFSPNRTPQMRERHHLVFWLRLVSKELHHSAIQTQKELDFSSSNSAPANRKRGFYANREQNKQEVGFIFAWSGSELWTLVKYSRSKIKNLKHIAVDVLLKGFPMITFSYRSNLAGTLPLNFLLCDWSVFSSADLSSFFRYQNYQ